MEHILSNALSALLDQPSAILPDILRMITSNEFRLRALHDVENEQVLTLWRNAFPNYSYRYQADGISPILNKIGAFGTDPPLFRIVTRSDRQLRLRSILDNGKVLLVNLAKGKIDEDSVGLLGAMLVTSLGLAAFSRANVPEHDRRPNFIYIDAFQNFTTLSSICSRSDASMASGSSAHQCLRHLDPDLREAVIGNAGTLISFRLGANDVGAHCANSNLSSITLISPVFPITTSTSSS